MNSARMRDDRYGGAELALTELLGRELGAWQAIVEFQRHVLLPPPFDQDAGPADWYLDKGLAFRVLALLEGYDPADWGQG